MINYVPERCVCHTHAADHTPTWHYAAEEVSVCVEGKGKNCDAWFVLCNLVFWGCDISMQVFFNCLPELMLPTGLNFQISLFAVHRNTITCLVRHVILFPPIFLCQVLKCKLHTVDCNRLHGVSASSCAHGRSAGEARSHMFVFQESLL